MKNKQSKKGAVIFKELKTCMKEMGYENPFGEQEGRFVVVYHFALESYELILGPIYRSELEIVEFQIMIDDIGQLTNEKIQKLCELFNRMNFHLPMYHFVLVPDASRIFLKTAMIVVGPHLNRREFKRAVQGTFRIMAGYLPAIELQIHTHESPERIMNHLRRAYDDVSDSKGNDANEEQAEKTDDLPFVIHACFDMPAFPTHTHGLMEVGVPEFLLDHSAFGVNGNIDRINWSYKFFLKPENRGKLEDIKNGKLLKLKIKDLYPEGKEEPLVYCYRRVEPDFQMVKEAYSHDDGCIDPQMWFIQIYIDGDDCVLTDEYYRGGINW